MSTLSLLLRNLRFFRLANLAVLAGMIIATAVLTGALMVGDSVRGSLRTLAEQRLGPIDFALVSGRFFDQTLAERLSKADGFESYFDPAIAGISLSGGCVDDQTGARVSGATISALTGAWVTVPAGSCVINANLGGLIGMDRPAQTISINLPAVDDPFRDATLARRGRAETTRSLSRVPVAGIVSQPGLVSLFNLSGGQRTPKNVWVDLSSLQNAVDQEGRVNLLLVHQSNLNLPPLRKTGEPFPVRSMLDHFLDQTLQLNDYGLMIAPGKSGSESTLGSADTYLMPGIVDAADKAAAKLNLKLRHVSTYLINTVVVVGGDENGERQSPSSGKPGEGGGGSPTSPVRLSTSTPSANGPLSNPPPEYQRREQKGKGLELHYAIAAGVDSLQDAPVGPTDIVLNQYAADHLHANVGDKVRLDYLRRNANGDLAEMRSDRLGLGLVFTVSRILPMSGEGADPTLAPQYKGLTDKKSISDWPDDIIKLNRAWVTKEDDAYWAKYKAAPKLFINLATARQLWGGTFGDLTGIRVPSKDADAFAKELRTTIDPASMGMVFQPIKQQQLNAANGSTDFAMLFVSFSFFLILAAVLLVAMLFRLNIEQRARQLGLLAALGFGPKQLRRLALYEGLLVAVIGALLGTAAAIGYTWFMVAGLRTWWVDAVGTSSMYLHVEPITLVIGFASSVVIALFAIWWGVWRVGRTSPSALLAGGWGSPTASRARHGKWAIRIGIVGIIAGIALLVMGLAKSITPQAACLGGGTLLLFAILTWLAGILRSTYKPRSNIAVRSIGILGIRNASRHTARSILTAGLIALATFALVIVASLRGSGPPNTSRRDSGAGGFNLILQADIPLLGDLSTVTGREKLGLKNPRDPLWDRVTFTSMRRWQGQDVSCLNLTKPTSPTILAVPRSLVDRKGDGPPDKGGYSHAFRFASEAGKGFYGNPWEELKGPTGEEISIFADDETAQYILNLDLGKTLEVIDGQGIARKLELVATLDTSIFQGVLLMGEDNFRNLFPSQSGFGTILIETKQADEESVRKLLTTELDDYSVTVDRTADRLAMYAQVASTYMATFQTLGSLGLLLGTIGLAVVLLRGLVERRAEMAMLASLGFCRVSRLGLVLAENVFLLVVGLLVGAACALAAVLPELFGSARKIHLLSLGITLAVVLVTGLLSLILAVWFGGRTIGAADLRVD